MKEIKKSDIAGVNVDHSDNEDNADVGAINFKQKKKNLPPQIEDFTMARVNESDLTTVLVETGTMPVPTILRECVSSGEDVSVNTVIIQRN